MANFQQISINNRLQGNNVFLEISDLNGNNLQLDGDRSLEFVSNPTITGNLTIQGTTLNASNATATFDKINIDEFIFTDNQAKGLSFKCEDDTEFMIFQSTNGGEQIQIKKDVFFSNSNALIMGTNPSKGNISYANITQSVISENNNEIVLLNFKDNQSSAVNGGSVILGQNGGFFFGYNQNLDNKPSGSDSDSNDLGSFYVKKSTNGTTSFFRGEVGTMAVSKLHLGELASSQTSSGEDSAILTHENFLGGGTNQIEMTTTGHIYFTTSSSKNVVFKSGIGDPLVKLGNVSTDDSTFNYILNAPRPNTSSGGCVLFINGSSRSSDGGNSAMTFRNDSGKLVLGNSSYDSILYGDDIGISAGGILDIDVGTTFTLNTTNGNILISASTTGIGNTASMSLVGDDEIFISKRADKFFNITKGTTASGDSDRNKAIFLGSTSANTTTGSEISQNGATCSLDGGANSLNIKNGVSGGDIFLTTNSGTIELDSETDKKAHINRTIIGASLFADSLTLAHEDRYDANGYTLFNSSTQTILSAPSSGKLRLKVGGDGGTDVITCESGKVGIFDNTPDYTLDVHNSQNINFTDSQSFTYWNASNGIISIGTGQNNEPICAVFNEGIWVRNHSFNTSDSRIKTDISDCDISDCLDKVNQIELKEYFYLDKLKGGTSVKTRGFIAQQVEQVYPRAINIVEGHIPDVMERIENIEWIDNSNGTYSFSYDLTLESNHTGKCCFYCGDTENDEKIVKVFYDSENRKFTFNKQYNYVFFYGRYINDLHTLDKQKINQLQHGAIQELSRENTELRNTINDLQNQINANNTTLINVLSRLQALEQ